MFLIFVASDDPLAIGMCLERRRDVASYLAALLTQARSGRRLYSHEEAPPSCLVIALDQPRGRSCERSEFSCSVSNKHHHSPATLHDNNLEPAYTGPTVLTSPSPTTFQAPSSNVNGAIKCQQVSGGDGYATMADGNADVHVLLWAPVRTRGYRGWPTRHRASKYLQCRIFWHRPVAAR